MTDFNPAPELIHEFLIALQQQSFEGEITNQRSDRIVHATDNSIYQIVPDAILYPKNENDVQIVTQLLSKPQFHKITVTAKGGGTGTNGQALNYGIILDLSRHMNHILSFDEASRSVTVEAGVIKDQLNDYLRPLGYFFAPELSTSNRATIGGMINTDACGQGSVTYGKTRHHVNALTAYLPSGQKIDTTQKTEIQAQLIKEVTPETVLINEIFPPLNRSITGYDLKNFINDEDHDLKHLFCGSEGTLGIITQATLNVLPIPKYKALIILSYDDFIKALEHAPYLMQSHIKPTAIEIMDDRVVERAQNDLIWETTQHFFSNIDYQKLKAILLVEFNSDDLSSLNQSLEHFQIYMEESQYSSLLSTRIVNDTAGITEIYALRKRAVGLLGNIRGERRTMPFVEDTAVPPEHLAEFVKGFKEILDRYELIYGMFGHVDAGVLHVRPALDLKTEEDRQLIRKITDEVFELCQSYHGALWGEHGKGIRSEYVERFFGALYPTIRKIKSAFDPHNQLNPGKIATPIEGEWQLYKIDHQPMKGEFDATISHDLWMEYRRINFCNGNGACFNYDVHSPMCPSYKATSERKYSPKGRAVILKEWLRQRSTDQVSQAYEEEIFDSLKNCLACAACSGECPVMIDIPLAKAKFLNEYYKTRKRPMIDMILSVSESKAPLLYQLKSIYNPIAELTFVKKIVEKIGLIDLPTPQENHLNALIKAGKATRISDKEIDCFIEQTKELTPDQKQASLIIIPDAFSEFFDGEVLYATVEFLNKLGVHCYIAPYKNSGKAQHVLGQLTAYETAAKEQHNILVQLAKSEIAMVGIEPPITLMYRREYARGLQLEMPNVQLIQEWLNTEIEAGRFPSIIPKMKKQFTLLTHCTERSHAPYSPALWQKIFTYFGQNLKSENTGCCGMGGMFGHLTEQKTLSQKMYDLSWRVKVDQNQSTSEIIATGYSCRTQVKRFSHLSIKHPIVKLNELL